MLFLPVAQLNQLRRETIELLEAQREAERPRPTGGVMRKNAPYPLAGAIGMNAPTVEMDFRGNVLNRKAEAFYRRHGVEEIEPAAESGLDLHGRVVMTTKLCLKYELGACPKMEKLLTYAHPSPCWTRRVTAWSCASTALPARWRSCWGRTPHGAVPHGLQTDRKRNR